MSQNHITFDGIPGRDLIDEPSLNTMGQYHGSYPWFCIFRVILTIRDLARYFPRAYATLSRQIRVCLETYSFHHVLVHTDIPYIITFCTYCRYIIFTSFNKFINSRTNSSSRLPLSSSSGLPSRTTLYIILPTISPFGLDGNHDGV